MIHCIQGRVQDVLIGRSNLHRGFDLLTLPDFHYFFQIFLKILFENEIILSKWGFE